MLHELKNARQIEGEGFRRWFTDPDMDLVIWYDNERANDIYGFQLSYDKRTGQHALTWTAKGGFQHNRVDDGEEDIANKMTPVLMQASGFDGARIHAQFVGAASNLEYGVVTLVRDRIDEYDRRYHQIRERHATGAHHSSILGNILLDCLRDAFYGPGLHGPSLLPTLKSLDVVQVAWQAERDNRVFGAWQVALHAAYWKRSVCVKFRECLELAELKPAHRFELEDWVVTLPPIGMADWQECLDALVIEHEALVAAVAELVAHKPQILSLVEAKSGLTWAQFVYGMAAHDVYHTAHLRNLGIPGLKAD